MSPRAAWRLERLGYQPVYDYAAGKVAWMAAGLPTVRADAPERRALDAADRSPPTCTPETPLDTSGLDATGNPISWSTANASCSDGSHPGAAPADRSALADVVMETGPTTVRAHEPLEPLLQRANRRQVRHVIVTTPKGRLLGVVGNDTPRR
jgi:hypothetical protein